VRPVALALAWASLALACGSLPLYEKPEERLGGVPLSQAPQPRTGDLTWRSETFEAMPDGLRFEFTLVNGTKRDYQSVMLRLVLRGGGAERRIATVRYPAGSLKAGGTRRVRAHLAPPGFAVESADIELIYAQE
jgi:hypothetical protein